MCINSNKINFDALKALIGAAFRDSGTLYGLRSMCSGVIFTS